MKSLVCLLCLLMASGSVAGNDKAKTEDCLFTVECAEGPCGSAFLLKDDDGVWMVSNCHVIAGKTSLKFIKLHDQSCVWSIPDEIELAVDRDAIRFRVAESNGLEIALEYSTSCDVVTFISGDGSAVKNQGKTIKLGGVGAEVTCEITEQNDGGPVVNAAGDVVGIATFLATSKEITEGKISQLYAGTLQKEEVKKLLSTGSSREKQKMNDFIDEHVIDSSQKDVSSDVTRIAKTNHLTRLENTVVWQRMAYSDLEKEGGLFNEKMDSCNCAQSSILMMLNKVPLDNSAGNLFFQPAIVRKYNREIAYKEFGPLTLRHDPWLTVICSKSFFKKLAEEADKKLNELAQSLSADFKANYFTSCINQNIDLIRQDVDWIKSVLE